MTKVSNLLDFQNVTSSITSFSHAYLFNVNSLESSFYYIKEFAKMIICQNYSKDSFEYQDVSYKIDNDEFDDLYVVNPSTIGINTDEIDKLLRYMSTKSIRENGRRVYIIYGYERLSKDVSNKILKFLEEPEENIYAILMTENIDKILSTITSRCQIINLTFDISEFNLEKIELAKEFLKKIFLIGKKTIAYEYEFFPNLINNRMEIYEFFSIIEQIISQNINKKSCCAYDEKFDFNIFDEYSIDLLINILNLTNKIKCLIKGNINLNLLVDRYIIEITKELVLCKK